MVLDADGWSLVEGWIVGNEMVDGELEHRSDIDAGGSAADRCREARRAKGNAKSVAKFFWRQ